MSSVKGFHFNTICEISAQADESLLEEALSLCPVFERLMSRFIEGSDVWNLNHAEGLPVQVSEHTLEVLKCADALSSASEGAFNIAIGAASKLWRFTDAEPVIPTSEQLEKAIFELRNFSIRFKDAGVIIPAGATIDLGGVAKGYACDRVADQLRERGVTNGILNFGGNVVTIGTHPEGRPWKVGLQTPNAKRNESTFAAVESVDSAVVTSGIYERCFTRNGTIYHHILDPRTGRPASTDIVSATVLSSDSMLADALATAILVLGSSLGLQLAKDYGVQTALLTTNNQLTYSAAMPLTLTE